MSTQTKQKDNSKSYGTFSIVILIISIVVGSGIFFKNEELYASTNSAITSIVAWFLVSGLVITMLYAFIEISSSTSKTGEIGSLSAWANKFYGSKSARVVGYFFVFINLPINVSLLCIYSSNLFFDLVMPETAQMGLLWTKIIGITIMAMLILGVSALINARSNKSSKATQQISFVFKLFPIVFIIGVFFAASISSAIDGNFAQGIDGYSSFWSSSKNSGVEDQSAIDVITLIVISIPPVMFAFDGFIYSANLQAETKNKKSFARGLTIGIMLIIVMYILVSIAMFSLGNGDYSLHGVIDNAFPNTPWLSDVFDVMLFVSIITGISGLFAASMRATASLSTDNLVKDEKMTLLRKNKNSIPSRSALVFFSICMFWIIYLRAFDTISFLDQTYWNPLETVNTFEVNFMAISSSAANSAVVLAFIFYAFIIFGGMLNRRNNKVEVDKLKGFTFISFIAIIGVLFVSTFSIVDIFFKDFSSVSDYLSIPVSLSYFIVIAVAYIYNKKKLDFLTDDFIVQKESYIQTYYE